MISASELTLTYKDCNVINPNLGIRLAQAIENDIYMSEFYKEMIFLNRMRAFGMKGSGGPLDPELAVC